MRSLIAGIAWRAIPVAERFVLVDYSTARTWRHGYALHLQKVWRLRIEELQYGSMLPFSHSVCESG